jgi:5-methylcytosine-specific restriction endonuclease McrA
MSMKGHKHTGEAKEKIASAVSQRQLGNKIWLGRKHSEESKKKMSDATRGIPRPNWRGEKAYQWKGGVTPINRTIRNSLEYRSWREAVFERDNYTCQFCGVRGGYLEADHIKQFAYFPDLRYEVLNGRTLCRPCHTTTPTFKKQKVIICQL